MYLGVLLKRIWYSPVLARTAEDGIRLSQGKTFALILLDGDVQESELKTAITLLKTDPSLGKLPLVVFMNNDNPGKNNSLITQGCSAVLTKPLDLAMVYAMLARLSGQPRTTPRIPVKMRVAVKLRVGIMEDAAEKELTSVNISEGGLYLRTLSPLPEGTLVHVKFTLPLDTEPIELHAEVIRTLPLDTHFEEDPGMGLRFIGIGEDSLLKIRNFVQWEMTGDLEWKSDI